MIQLLYLQSGVELLLQYRRIRRLVGSNVTQPYDGSVVNMGVKNSDGSVCYIIGFLKDIRAIRYALRFGKGIKMYY